MAVTLLVGTTKGAFLLHGDDTRQSFETTGPFLAGSEVYAMAYDPARDRILASAGNPFFGTTLASSSDRGVTWEEPETPNVAFPEDTGAALQHIWQIVPDGDRVWLGVEPAALFRSDDGEKYELVRGLWDHPQRPSWQPGGGGLCLHSILLDGPTIYVAVSSAGVYRSDDGGETWQPRNSGIRVDFAPETHPEFGQCVHKIDFDASGHDVLWAQNHGGLYRSDDRADHWQDVGNGVPSDFGFPIVAHPTRPGTAYVIPLEGAMWRATPEGKARVYRTTDNGASWHPLTEGLPQESAHLTVLRDGFGTDGLDPAGLYFGTRSGEVYASADDGEHWRLLAQHLPPVTCVKAAVLG